MSLVGTRPPTLDEWEKYELHHRARLAIKPGITGMWQVSGRSDITDFEEVVKLDMKYIANWNFGLDDKVDNPVSLYAATKKSNELMAHAYSKLYNIPSTGLRFFTVYGPAGRPDMAYFGFTNKLVNTPLYTYTDERSAKAEP